jgi:hypothetical protein
MSAEARGDGIRTAFWRLGIGYSYLAVFMFGAVGGGRAEAETAALVYGSVAAACLLGVKLWDYRHSLTERRSNERG